MTYVVGNCRHPCEVIEQVGQVGRNYVHYYRLREPIWYGEPQEFELPENSLEPATQEDLDSRYPPEQRAAHAS